MLNVVLPAAAVVGILAAAFFLFLRRIVSPNRTLNFDQNWFDDFSVARYRPMERLLSEEDYEFLKRQPGYTPGIRRKLRAQRRAIFRDYLHCLSRDFEQLYGAVQHLMLTSQEDRPDLAAALLRMRWTFTYGMAVVHCRLFLHALGKQPVEVQGLVNSFESLRWQFQQLSTVQAAA